MGLSSEHIQRCINCMGEKRGGDTCPLCGYRESEADFSPQFLSPRSVLDGRYFVGRVLGHGGFGITYLAWDMNLEVLLAIKEYLPREVANREAGSSTIKPFSGQAEENFTYGLDKFSEEARTLAKFHEHPGIVTVHNFFRANGTGYMVMQYVGGATLKQYLVSQGGRIGYDLAVKILMPVMDALRELHGVGLLHRDISPDNIYITDSKRVKLLDFGAARYAAGEHSRSLSVILKPGYAPEEQYRSKGKQGPWTDVYALCATLYRAITGKTPPEALDRMDDDELKAPSVLGIALPPPAEAALMKGLAIRGGNRWQTAHELQDALMGGMETLPTELARPKVRAKVESPPAGVKPAIQQSMPAQKAASLIEKYQTGQVFRDGTSYPEMVVVTAGKFMMGSPADEKGRGRNEAPQHEVVIGQPFAVGKYPVTFDEWSACVADGGSNYRPNDQDWGRGSRPVINVSWNEAQQYVAWLSQKTGQDYRLLTEAEWEYAARAGSTTAYPWGKKFVKGNANVDFDITVSSWLFDTSPPFKPVNKTTPVGCYPPNAFGLYDMCGNVFEWVEDGLHDNYVGAPYDGTVWQSDIVKRRLRGGSWYTDQGAARSANRFGLDATARYSNCGFRIATDAPFA